LIHLQWSEPDDGGSPILGYIVYYKLVGAAAYEELVGEVSGFTLLEYRITHGVIEGASYEFIVKAINRWGESTWFSDPTVILAATIPGQVLNVVTTIDPITGGLLVQWDLPLDQGTAVTDYFVEIEAKSTDFEKIASCTGTELSCLIPMSVIRDTPVSLEF
jgi:hypothetical protein